MQLSGNKIRRIALLVLLLGAAGWVVTHYGEFDVEQFESWVGSTGYYAPAVYMLFAAAATVLLVPGSLFVLVGGVLFGPLLGTLYSLFGATLGAALAFLIARYIAADWIVRKSRGRFKQLMDGVEAEGWRFVAFVRLVPIFPFFLLNYALGLTRISFYPYIVTTFICSLPGVAAITYLGYVGKEALTGGEALIQKLLIALGLLVIMAYLPRFITRLHDRKSHRTKTSDNAGQ
ncbi:MAG: TVP38/TMEM64 family protein [Candidatus Polarisedimenticolaceae bacterium]|nr:TVP38/TMEM64 family protein [Candidatus Polarisedimenticolaceae bacterium]